MLGDRIAEMGYDAVTNIVNVLNDILKEMLRMNKEETRRVLMETAQIIAEKKYPFTDQIAANRILAGTIQDEELKQKIIALLDKEADMRDMGQDISDDWKENIDKLINDSKLSRKEKNVLLEEFAEIHRINKVLNIPEMGEVEHFRSKVVQALKNNEDVREILEAIDKVAEKQVSKDKGLAEIEAAIIKSKLSDLEKQELRKFLAAARHSTKTLSRRTINADVYNNMKWALTNKKLSDKVTVIGMTNGQYMLVYPSIYDSLVLDMVKAHSQSLNTAAELKRVSEEVLVFDNVDSAVAYKALQINRSDGRTVKFPMAIEPDGKGKYKVYFKIDAEDRQGQNEKYTMANKVMASAIFSVASGEKDNIKEQAEFKLREMNAVLDAVKNIHNKENEIPYITGKYTKEKNKTYAPRDGGVIIRFKNDFKAGVCRPAQKFEFNEKSAVLRNEDGTTLKLNVSANMDLEQYKKELIRQGQTMAEDAIFIPMARYNELKDRSMAIINNINMASKNAKVPIAQYINTRLQEIQNVINDEGKQNSNYGVYIKEKNELLAMKSALGYAGGKTTVNQTSILDKLLTDEYMKHHHYNITMLKKDSLEATMTSKISSEYRQDNSKIFPMNMQLNTIYNENQNIQYHTDGKDTDIKTILDALYKEQHNQLTAQYNKKCTDIINIIKGQDPETADKLQDMMNGMQYNEVTPGKANEINKIINESKILTDEAKEDCRYKVEDIKDTFGYDLVDRKDAANKTLEDISERRDKIEMTITDNILKVNENAINATDARESSWENVEEEAGYNIHETTKTVFIEGTHTTEKETEILEDRDIVVL